MKRNNIFVAHLARGAFAASALAVTSSTQSAVVTPATSLATEVAFATPPPLGPGAIHQAGATSIAIAQTPGVWDNSLEKEFHALASAEANRTLTAEQAQRLDRLNTLRDRLRNPLAPEDIFTQI